MSVMRPLIVGHSKHGLSTTGNLEFKNNLGIPEVL